MRTLLTVYSAMKKIKLFAIIMTCLLNVNLIFAESYDAMGTNRVKVSTNVRVGELWGERWNRTDFKVATAINDNKMVLTLYPRTDEAWNYFCKITISDFSIPTWKEIKQHQKKDSWFYYYDCEVEFFYNVEYPSIEECFANYGCFVVNSKNKEAKRRVVKGERISLNPYFFTAGSEQKDINKMNMTLNCFFDEVGVAISFQELLNFKKYLK